MKISRLILLAALLAALCLSGCSMVLIEGRQATLGDPIVTETHTP